MLFTKLFRYVLTTTLRYNIDESHGLSHSMNTLFYANRIFSSEVIIQPSIKDQERLIYVSAIMHDMCDKKYTDKTKELVNIENFLGESLKPFEVNATSNIISTMSYSYVKNNGFPNLGEYQTAYNIVREADLLTAYDFDRCMIYNIYNNPSNDLRMNFHNAKNLFTERVLMHNEHGLFFTDYAKKHSIFLHKKSLERMWFWKKILDLESFGFDEGISVGSPQRGLQPCTTKGGAEEPLSGIFPKVKPRSSLDVMRADDLRSDCCAISTDDETDKPE
jgi:hypothetical protein